MTRDKLEWLETVVVLFLSAVVASIVTVVLFPFLLFLVVWFSVFAVVAVGIFYLLDKFRDGGKRWEWK